MCVAYDGNCFFWRPHCWFFFPWPSVASFGCPVCPSCTCLKPGKGYFFRHISMCLSAFLHHHLPLSRSATHTYQIASLLPIWNEKLPQCLWFHEQPLRSWVMQPESEGEFTWLLPSRQREKGRSQRNSLSSLPPCIPSREVLVAKPTSCCPSSWLGKQDQLQIHLVLMCVFLYLLSRFPLIPIPWVVL